MTTERRQSLEELALRVRGHIVRLSGNGGCFIGASLSCADILTYIYASGEFHVGPDLVTDPHRDFILLSKGHDVPALYGVLTELGFFPIQRLQNHLHVHDSLYWHPNRTIPGIEFHSGSLGHLLAVGAGMALSCKQDGRKNRVVVILGDGELNEGSVWETCLVASALRLDNLIAIVDRNGFQANTETEKLIPLEPLKSKFQSFGWSTTSVDGHSFDEMEAAFLHTSADLTTQPRVIIAHTVRGKGLPSIEQRADRWFANFSAVEVSGLLDELRGKSLCTLRTEGEIVR